VAGVAGVAAPTARLLPGATGYPPQPTGFQGPPPRRRGRALPVLIGLLVLAILAGAAFAVLRLRNHGLGGPVTTITRTTSPTSPPVSATSTPPPSAAPADVVRAFYTAINNQDYRTAWNLDQSVHSSESYGQFKSGYSTTTASTALTVVSVSGDVVQIKLTANQLDGTIKYYAGTYTVQNGAITGSNIQQVGGP